MPVICIGTIIALEISSRTSTCSISLISGSMPVCSNNLYTDDPNNRNCLNELSGKYSRGLSPSPEEMEKAVMEVDRTSIGGANGVYCSGVPFVSTMTFLCRPNSTCAGMNWGMFFNLRCRWRSRTTSSPQTIPPQRSIP